MKTIDERMAVPHRMEAQKDADEGSYVVSFPDSLGASSAERRPKARSQEGVCQHPRPCSRRIGGAVVPAENVVDVFQGGDEGEDPGLGVPGDACEQLCGAGMPGACGGLRGL